MYLKIRRDLYKFVTMKTGTGTILLIGAGGLAVWYFLKGKARAAQNLRFEPVDFKIDLNRTRQSLFTRLYYTVKINIINPERFPVNVRLVNLQVNAAGAKLGDLTSSKPFIIAPASNQIVPIDAAISIFGALGTVINFIKNRKPIPVNITGYVDSDLGRLDIEYNTEVL